MRAEHIIERQGKKMVLYGGLLDAAHQQGLKAIDTEPIQIPTDANNNVSITKATVELEDGRKFSGIGDASPQNVGKMIKDHIIRMSETRAKSRALRDAVNVGELIVDESEIDADEARQQISSLRREPQASSARGAQPNARTGLRKQLYELMYIPHEPEDEKTKNENKKTWEWIRTQSNEELERQIAARG